MHLASPRDLELIGRFTVAYAERNVLEQLTVEPCTELARGDELALLAGEGAVVYRDRHLQGRLAYLDEFKRLGGRRLCDRVADRDLLRSREGDYVADLCLGAGDP